MNLKQLRDSARLRLFDTKLDYLWSDDELNDFINQAINEAVIRSRSILDSTTPECSRIAVVAGKNEYPVHDAVFQITRVFSTVDNQALQKTSFNDLDEYLSDWQTSTGKPTHYVDDLNHYGADGDAKRSITLFPIPDVSNILNLTVYRTPLGDLDNDFDTPEISVFQHPDLLYWVLHLAYMKQDSDAFDIAKSMEFDQRFTLCFGEKQDARKLEWRRKHNRLRTTGQYF